MVFIRSFTESARALHGYVTRVRYRASNGIAWTGAFPPKFKSKLTKVSLFVKFSFLDQFQPAATPDTSGER
jgi:hypothetical protein